MNQIELQFYPPDISTNKKQQEQETVEYLRKHQDVISSLAESVQKLQQQLNQSEKKANIKLEFDNIEESNQKEIVQLSDKIADQLIPETQTPKIVYRQREVQQIPLLLKQSSPYALPSMSLPNTYEIERMKQQYKNKLSIMKNQNEDLIRQHDNELLRLQKERADPRRKSNQNSQHSILSEKKSRQAVSQHSQSVEELERKIGAVGIRALMKKDRRTPSPLLINDSKVSQGMKDSKLSNASSKNLKSPHQLVDRKKEKEKLKPMKPQPQKQQKPKPVSRASRLQQVSKQDDDDDDEEIVYQLDEDGYLMNEKGEYLLDAEGNFVQITPEQLEELRAQNLIEEEY